MNEIKYDTINFTIPEWAMCSIINGDNEGLTEEEEQEIDYFLKEYPGIIIPCPNDDNESYFSHENDINYIGGNVYDLECLVPIKEIK